jgi:hypothetical protein
MKNLIIRKNRVHRILTDEDGWPSEPFISVADTVDVRLGDVMIDSTFARADSAAAARYAANSAALDAKIETALDALRGKSIAAMTNAERFDLLAIMARKLGIEVKP